MPDYALTVARTAQATAEAERAHYETLWVQACAERDTALLNAWEYERQWTEARHRAEAAEQRATRLAALEDAARAFIEDSEAQGGPPPEACNACYWKLMAAVAALTEGTNCTKGQ